LESRTLYRVVNGGPTATKDELAWIGQRSNGRMRRAACRLQSPVHVDGRVGVKLTLVDARARVAAKSGRAWVRLGLKAYGKSLSPLRLA
jgi:hypothetical protein